MCGNALAVHAQECCRVEGGMTARKEDLRRDPPGSALAVCPFSTPIRRKDSHKKAPPCGGAGIRPSAGLIQPRALALATTFSTVKPNFSRQTGPGAEAPKRSIEMQAPSKPVYLCQPKELEASTTTRLRTAAGSTLSR